MQIMLPCTKYSANYKKSNVHETIKTWTTNGLKQCNPKAVYIKMWTIWGVHIKYVDSIAT